MPFSQQYILSVNPPTYKNGEAFISWTDDAPSGSWYQGYIDLQLTYVGTKPFFWTPIPQGPTRIDIGTVDPADKYTDYSSTLTPGPKTHATLNWIGGLFESTTLAGFYVYQSSTANGPVNYTTPAATIAAFPQGISMSGWGLGGWGQGGWGYAGNSYSWESESLTTGTWSFSIVPFDKAGNAGVAMTTSIAILAPPLEVAPFSDNSRLHYTFNSASEEITLTWNASPSA